MIGAGEEAVHVEPFVQIVRLDRRAGGDFTEHRQSLRGWSMIDQLDRASGMHFTRDQALFLESLEMAHHAVGRFDLEGQSNLAHRGAVTALFDLLADKMINLCLTFGQLAKVCHDNPFTDWVRWNGTF